MSNSVSDLRDTIVPKSDQLNAEQLLGGPITITVTDVRRGGGEEQPVIIHYEGEGGRPYKPCKSMRKVLVFAWGGDGREWIGRSMTVYNRPDVKFGGEEVGGIRISHLSHIDRDIAISLTATRGRKEQTRIRKLDEAATVAGSRARLEAAARGGMNTLKDAWSAIPKDHQRAINGTKGCPDDLKAIAAAADARTAGGERAPESSTQSPVDALIARMASAADIDALNDVYDGARDIEASEDERRAMAAAYEKRADELDA